MSAAGQGAPSVGGTRAPPPHLRTERGGSRDTERDRRDGDIPQAVTPRTRRPAEAEREARGGFGGGGAPATRRASRKKMPPIGGHRLEPRH